MTHWLFGSGPLGVREPGGAPTRPVADFIAAVAASLVEQGDQVTLLLLERQPNPDEIAWLAHHRIGWRYWGDGRPTTLAHARVLWTTLRELHIDAVMFQFGAISLGMTVAFAARIPLRIARYLTAVAAMKHDGESVGRVEQLRRRLVYKTATHIAVNARPLVDEVQTIYGVPRERILLQLQGVHEPDAPAGERSLSLVCVGRIAPTKGQHILVEALALLAARGLHPPVVLVGGGALPVPAGVELRGQLDRRGVYRALQSAAIAVQPSLSEGLPQSVQEAAICGCVVVASAVGGIPDVVIDGETGVLVPPGDARALADALEPLLRDPALLTRMTERAAAHASRMSLRVRAPAEARRLRMLAGATRATNDLLEIPQ